MKKLSFFLWASIALIFLNCSNQSTAQPPPNLSMSEQMDYLMAPLDFTEVTSGLLLDKGFPMMEIAAFDGTTSGDTIKEYGDWFRQFGTMVTSKTGTTSPIGVTADYKPLADSLLKSDVIPIMVLHAEYHKFISDSTALSALITFQNNQLNDLAGRTSSPYVLHEIVSFSPKQNKFYDKLSHDFRINADFIRTNVSKTISTIQIDFDNGSGYQTMTLGSNSKITWSTFGKKVLKLKITYTDNSVYHAKAQINLIDKSGGQPKYNSTRDETVYIPHPTIANHGVELAIAYGCGNNNELRKPFIYVEGFNPELFGDQFYEDDFFDDFDFYETEQWPSGFPLLSELDENGYDVVYVDFDRGDGSLIENAKALQAAINWINEEKAANCSSSDNILVGYSMGGVVARLALTYMEDDAEDHEVSYYVSVDSPHRGANIPRGVIAALIDIRNYHYAGFDVSEDVPQVEEAYQVLFSPAAKQMLLYSGEGSNTLINGHGPTYTSFQNHLHNEQGMPTQTLENIAIAKGGGTGAGQFGSMAAILDINTNTFNALGCFTDVPNVVGWFAGAFALLKLGLYAKVVVDVNAMPGYVSYPLEIYERKIRLLVKIPIINIPYFYWDSHNTDAQYVNFYDGVQGGTYDISSFSTDDDDLAALIDDVVDGEYEPCVELHQRTFAFIPTASALDLENFMGYPNSNPSSIIAPSAMITNGETPFQKVFILDPTQYPSGSVAPTNESHLDLTPSNIFPFSNIVPPAFNTNSIGSIAGFSYNHGFAGESDGFVRTSDRITRLINVGVSQTGSLCVNCTGVLEISSQTSNPQNAADHFAVELTQNCGFGIGRLNIGANGTLKIGENSSKTGMMTVRGNSWIELNDGIIEIREGSKLIIDAGAELRLNGGAVKVYDGGEIIIKEGGVLIYEDGVSVELNGNDAQLALGGRTHVGNNATFTFTYQGNESGYIRLLEEGHWGERFSTGINSRVHLEGEGMEDKILHLEHSADFWEYQGNVPNTSINSAGFESVEIDQGLVQLENNARFVAISRAEFDHVKFQSSNSRGIKVFSKTLFNNCNVIGTKIDAPLHYLNDGLIEIRSSTLYNSDVHVKGFGFLFRYSEFDGSHVFSEQSTIANRFFSCNSYNVDTGILDVSSTDLIVIKSSFEGAYEGIYKKGGNVTLKCSDFINNYYALWLEDGAVLNMSTQHQGGYNLFSQNEYNVFFMHAGGLMMADGYNEFYDAAEKNMAGILDIPHIPCPRPFDLKNNIWTPASGSTGNPNNPLHPDMSDFFVTIQSATIPPVLYCIIDWEFGTVAPVVQCGAFDDTDPDVPIDDGLGKSAEGPESLIPHISTPTYFDSTRFDIAALEATNMTTITDSIGNNFTAAGMYYEILKAVIPAVNDSIDHMVEFARWNLLSSYKTLIEYMLATEELNAEESQVQFGPVIQPYVDVLMHYTDSVKTMANYKTQFILEMNKVALFNVLNKTEVAHQILEILNACDHDSIQRVILNQEILSLSDIISSRAQPLQTLLSDSTYTLPSPEILSFNYENVIDSSGFGSYIQNANTVFFSACDLSQGPIYSSLSQFGGQHGMESDFTVYPNPAQSEIHVLSQNISYAEDSPTKIFTLLDMMGKEIYHEVLSAAQQEIRLPKFAAGTYLYTITTDSEVLDQGRLIFMQ